MQQKEEELQELMKNLKESEELRKKIEMQKEEEKVELEKKIREE